VACCVELSSIQFVNILRSNCNKNVNSLNLGCLHLVACVISGVFIQRRWSDGYFFYVTSTPVSFLLVCIGCFFAVVWCVSAAGGAFACSGVTVCRVLSRLCTVLKD
jgi:predicted transporter